MINLKNAVLCSLVLSSSIVNAKEFIIGYKKQIDNSYFNSNIKIKKVFKTLDMVAVEANLRADLDYLNLDPNINFVEVTKNYQAPKKFISKPYPQLSKSKSRKVIKPVGISLVKADKVWETTTQGEGIRVLVLDSGIDETHPAIVGNLEKAKNFIGSDESDYKDNNGHGTHVAGTIAASGPLLGVAPKVKILMGKVCNTGCGSMAILNGVEWGIKEKVDVMNLSLGGMFFSNYERQAYKKAQESNIVVVAASGNDGAQTSSYPASFEEVFSVGAVDKNLMIADFSNWNSDLDVVAPGVDVYSSVPRGSGRAAIGEFTTNNETLSLKLNPMTGSGVDKHLNVEIVPSGLGTIDAVSGLDLTGKIALIQRGEISFKEKHDNAIAKGAVGVIVYNNVDGNFTGTLGEDFESEYIAMSLSKEDGEKLVELINENELSANVAVEATDYQNNNGTSMASPHVAGVAALIRATNPSLNAVEVKNLMRSTTTATRNAEPVKYGNGFINAQAAAQAAQNN